MAQAQKAKSKAGEWRKISIFIALVIVSGVALGFTNNLQNPFDVFAKTGTFIATGGQSSKMNNTLATPAPAKTAQPAVVSEGGKTAEKSPSKTEAGQTAEKTEGKAEASKTPAANGEGGKTAEKTEGAKAATPAQNAQTQANRNNEMQWGLYGRLLFNLWFLAAITATMMLVGPCVGFVVKKLQKPAKKAVASRPVRA